MNTIQQVEEAVRGLSADELAAFRAWFAEYDAEAWDRQFEADVAAGRLDWLAEEARRNLQPLTRISSKDTFLEAVSSIQRFEKESLTKTISEFESNLQGKDKNTCKRIISNTAVNPSLLNAALTLKRVAGQTDTRIHAVSILLSLPRILQAGEVVEALSLGAGNTGKPFDLETNRRVAEFKFINWKGGPESIRQNSLFKDFYLLAEYETPKERYLYVVGTHHPLRFLKSGRSIKSVLSRNNKLWTEFQSRYGDQFTKVREYYKHRESCVQLVDITEIVPQFTDGPDLEGTEEDKKN